MTLKSFEMDWEGRKETIEYEDDISFGEMNSILRVSIDLTNITAPKVNIGEYQINILLKTLRKAPFNFKSVGEIRAIKRKQASTIISRVMQDYPLADCLEDWMTSFVGSGEAKLSNLVSMPSAPTSSDGQNEKQTNTPQSGSKNSSQ